MPTFGIDVSKWQGNYNFDLAKSQGVKFAILRGAYARTKDPKFEKYYSDCEFFDLPVGVYQYSMATTVVEAEREAAFLYENVLKGKRFEYPIYIDIEDKVQLALSRDLLTNIALAWCTYLEKRGYYVGIYAGKYTFRDNMHDAKLKRFTHWVPLWSTACTYEDTSVLGMWQFGGEVNKLRSNVVAGVVCDQNYAYVDFPTIIKKGGLNGFSGSQTAKTKSVEELAEEVIKGLWGVGNARKLALLKAGYDFAAVQAKVNELLNKNVEKIAKEVIAGKWGVGRARQINLTKAGYNYNEVQTKVNELLTKRA